MSNRCRPVCQKFVKVAVTCRSIPTLLLLPQLALLLAPTPPNGIQSARDTHPFQSPTTWWTVTLRRFQTLMFAIAMIRAASARSS